MGVIDLLVPTLLTVVAIGLSFFDTAFIQAKVHDELPDQILVSSSDYRETMLRNGAALVELPVLSLIQKDQIKEICRERVSLGACRAINGNILFRCARAQRCL
jgi:hypothetical protein